MGDMRRKGLHSRELDGAVRSKLHMRARRTGRGMPEDDMRRLCDICVRRVSDGHMRRVGSGYILHLLLLLLLTVMLHDHRVRRLHGLIGLRGVLHRDIVHGGLRVRIVHDLLSGHVAGLSLCNVHDFHLLFSLCLLRGSRGR